MFRSGNPVLKDNTFATERLHGGEVMTIQGTVNKSFLLLGLLVFTASWAWSNPVAAQPFLIPSAIGGFVIAMVTAFKKEWAPITGPIYALAQGFLLGTISLFFEKQYPGIVMQAVGLTFGTLFSLLIAYKSGLIRATENFKLGVVAATGGIAILYLVSFVMGFFGRSMPFLHESTPIGIGFSVFVVFIAALNLVLDFDFIENGSEQGAPKYMEWYGAFGLMVTLVWLYLEILRLLAKLNSRRD